MGKEEWYVVCDFMRNRCIELRDDILVKFQQISDLRKLPLADCIREEQSRIIERNTLYFSVVLKGSNLDPEMTFPTLFQGWRKIYNFLEKSDSIGMLEYYMGLGEHHPGYFVVDEWFIDFIEYVVLICLYNENKHLTPQNTPPKVQLEIEVLYQIISNAAGNKMSDLEKRTMERGLELKRLRAQGIS